MNINLTQLKAAEPCFRHGFTTETIFQGEYVLLMHPKTLQRIRIYTDGAIWKTNLKTGEYES